MKKSLGDRIRLYRLERNLSQENIANELNISTSTYSNIERGVTDVSIGRLEQIAKIFKLKVTDFFQDPAETNVIKEPTTNEYLVSKDEEIKKIYQKLTECIEDINILRKEVHSLKTTYVSAKKRTKKS